MKRIAFILVTIVLITAWLVLSQNQSPKPTPSHPSSTVTSPSANPNQTQNPKPETPPSTAGTSPIAENLNAPTGTIRRDLEILHEVFAAWQTNFPHEGNPVGENAEIAAALTGKNKFSFAFIAPGHRALNANGELCDRWGTPFFFHALSGAQMEIRSAGPDKKLYTPDDVLSLP